MLAECALISTYLLIWGSFLPTLISKYTDLFSKWLFAVSRPRAPSKYSWKIFCSLTYFIILISLCLNSNKSLLRNTAHPNKI